MSIEIPSSADNPYRLDLKNRNVLQAKIFETLFEQRGIIELLEQAALVGTYGKKISDIIDAQEHEAIRVLARNGDYDAASEAVLALLGDDMKIAA